MKKLHLGAKHKGKSYKPFRNKNRRVSESNRSVRHPNLTPYFNVPPGPGGIRIFLSTRSLADCSPSLSGYSRPFKYTHTRSEYSAYQNVVPTRRMSDFPKRKGCEITHTPSFSGHETIKQSSCMVIMQHMLYIYIYCKWCVIYSKNSRLDNKLIGVKWLYCKRLRLFFTCTSINFLLFNYNTHCICMTTVVFKFKFS